MHGLSNGKISFDRPVNSKGKGQGQTAAKNFEVEYLGNRTR